MAKDKPGTASPATDDDWQVEDALRTLTRAQEIQADAKLMAKVRAKAKDKIDDMQGIAGGKLGQLVRSGRISEKQARKLQVAR